RIRKDALRVVLPHLNEAGQVVPAADVRPKEPTPQDPGDGGQEPARIALLIEDLDLKSASLDADHAFQPCQQLLHNEGLLRSVNLRDVVVHADASAGETLVLVECPETSDGNQA